MTDTRSVAAVILAAGQGTRLKSATPKVLLPLGGRPLMSYAIEAAETITGRRPVLVVAPGAEAVRRAAGDRVHFAEQAQALGTAHAVQQAAGLLAGQADLVLVTYADMPLLRVETLRALLDRQRANAGPLTALTVHSPRLRDFGRVVRAGDGALRGVVEAAQATVEELALTEVNVGAYCFDADWLWAALPRLPLSPKGEYYLTDAVGLAVSEGGRVATVTTEDEDEASGVNTRAQLAQAEAALRRRINTGWLEAGVTLLDPATAYIEPGVQLGRDSVILPNTHLQGRTVVGGGCVIGPNTIIRDSVIGDGCRVECSVLEGATLAEAVEVGPFAHLRLQSVGPHDHAGAHGHLLAESFQAHSGRAVRFIGIRFSIVWTIFG